MRVGIIGLGKMGNAIAFRLLQAGHEVVGFDLNKQAQEQARSMGVQIVTELKEVAQGVDAVWLMVPAGEVVDTTIAQLKPHLKSGSIIIDGGNSNFKDSIRRAEELQKNSIHYLDVGTSGGLLGRDIGFSLMIGGDKKAFNNVEPLFKAIAMHNGYAHLGPSGAGHYVKMVHNGIEYALLQAYAEGFDLLKHGHYKELDMQKVSKVWSNGSVIRSWIVDLAHNVFQEDQDFKTVSGKIGGGSTGRWTVEEAQEQGIPVMLIEDALKIRNWSQKTGGNYATKLVALLRNQFGGHPVEKIKATNENN